MMKTQRWFEVVQVVRRDPSKGLLEWFDGDQLSSLQVAREEMKKARKSFPQEQFTIIEKRITERK